MQPTVRSNGLGRRYDYAGPLGEKLSRLFVRTKDIRTQIRELVFTEALAEERRNVKVSKLHPLNCGGCKKLEKVVSDL
jgi:hypothetical protein